ncbi:MAG: hypothetical protein ACYC8W_02005 [Candidatus Tyrphobacter sp.]
MDEDVISSDSPIGGDDRHILDVRLRHEQTVEGIPMDIRQLADG